MADGRRTGEPSLLAATLVSLGGTAALRSAWLDRRLLASWALTGVLSRRAHRERDHVDLGQGVSWLDDWFAIAEIAPRTFAIGEPRYYQQNWSYLIVGDERALLFDTGPGVRSIKALAEQLTDLPISVLASHVHFDHVGGHGEFASVDVADVPGITDQLHNGIFVPTRRQHLGQFEGQPRPQMKVADRWAPGQEIDLGGRRLEVVHSPGHTPESISLHDVSDDLLFTGDFLYRGTLIAALPGSDLDAYRSATDEVTQRTTSATRLFGAHDSEGGTDDVPELDRTDLFDLWSTLNTDNTLAGAIMPKTHRVNDRISLMAW